MKTALTSIFIIAALIINFFTITSYRRMLDDCRFEVNHLQVRLYRLQELSDYVSVLDQILTPLQMAKLKVANEQIKRQKYKDYERYEQPLIGD